MLQWIIWVVILIVIFNYAGDSRRRKKAGRGKQKAPKGKDTAGRKKEAGKAMGDVRDTLAGWEKEEKKSQKAGKKKQGKKGSAQKNQEEKRKEQRVEEERQRQEAMRQPERGRAEEAARKQERKIEPGNLNELLLSGKYEDGTKEPFHLEYYLDPLTAPFYPGNENKEKGSGIFCTDDYLFPALSPFYLELTGTGMDDSVLPPAF